MAFTWERLQHHHGDGNKDAMLCWLKVVTFKLYFHKLYLIDNADFFSDWCYNFFPCLFDIVKLNIFQSSSYNNYQSKIYWLFPTQLYYNGLLGSLKVMESFVSLCHLYRTKITIDLEIFLSSTWKWYSL